jgi:predicted DNA binding protein
MTVIVELGIRAREFELGRILQVENGTEVVLETMVPVGERSIPFFRVHDGNGAFEATVREHSAVNEIHEVTANDGGTLYALDWEVSDDAFFAGVLAMDAHVLEARGSAETWGFELRFPSHEALSEFQAYCTDTEIPLEVRRIYNPTKPDAGPWYGLTASQRLALVRAVEEGYYSIPRQVSTKDLADEFGISDQAVTERLRRGIATLVTNTLLLSE